jgi:putative flippase GtrA
MRPAPDLLLLPRGSRPSGRGQGVRFALAGCTVGLIYLTTTTVLADVVGLPFEVALPIGFSIALIVHFTLQRVFVWSHSEAFALPLRHQATRYLAAAAVQYGLTAASTSLLPSLLGVPTETVYVVTVGVLAVTNFLLFRRIIFHVQPTATEAAPAA